jgi:hypothetical protein
MEGHMTDLAPATRTRLDTALARAEEARRLRSEHPEMTLEQIGAALGVSRQGVHYLLRNPPVERWPEDVLAAMCQALAAGATPQDLLAIPGVAGAITTKRTRGKPKLEADAAQDRRRLSSLRKAICIGKNLPAGSAGRRLYDARQAGLDAAVAGWPEDVLVACEDALRAGAKYAEVMVTVPELAQYLGEDETRAATMLRVIVESGEDRPAGTRGRRLFDARVKETP